MKKKTLLLILLMTLLAPWAVNAQTVEIGSGASSAYTAPINQYWNYSLDEMLYLADEIAAGNPTSNTILSIGFNSKNGSANKTYTIEVYMKNVDLTEVAASYETMSPDDMVYSGTLDAFDAGWVTIDLDNPFTYDNTKNLMVVVNKTGGGYAGSSYHWYYTTTTGNSLLNKQNDNNTYDATNPPTSPTVGTARPDIQITFGTPSSCAKPTALAASTNSQSATITWSSEDSQWEVAYATDNTVDPSDYIAATVNTNTYTANGLTLDTDYYFWVRTKCSATEVSAWAGPVKAHIGYCVPAPASVDGNGISNVTFGTGDYVVNNDTPKATYADYHSLVGAVRLGVESTIAITYATGYTYGTVIWVDLNNNMSFEDDEIIYHGQSGNTNPYTLEATVVFPTTQALGDYRMRIGGADSAFDDIEDADPCYTGNWACFQDYTLRLLEAPSCLAPTGLAASAEYGHGATISWNSEADAWVVAYKKAADENFTEINVTANPYTFSGLDPETTYDVKVKTDCGGTYSDYTNPINFTTTVACPAPTGLAATLTNGNGTIATLTWTETGEATNWVLEYGTADDFSNATSVNVTDTPSADLTGLTAETKYYARVKAACGGIDGESAWSSSIEFEPTNKLLVGSGTATNNYLPAYVYYKHSLTEQIYTVEELGDAGLIESIDFYCSTASTYEWIFEIYVVNTDKSSFVEDEAKTSTDWIAVTEDDLFYSDQIRLTAGWNTFEFTEPFIYEGTQNIAIVVKTDFVTNYETAIPYRVFDATAQAIRVYNDNTEYDPQNPSEYAGTIMNVKNQLRLMKSDIPSCFKPTQLTETNVTGHTATITWESNAEAWHVRIDEGREKAVTEKTYTFTGLDPETAYLVEVRANCGNGDYSDWVKLTVTTDVACPAPTELTASNVTSNSAVISWEGEGSYELQLGTIVSEKGRETITQDFENGMGDWTTIDADGDGFTWTLLSNIESVTTYYTSHDWQYTGNDAIFSGSYVNGASVTTTPDNILVSPLVTLGGSITFYARGIDSNYPEHFGVCVSTTGNTSADDFIVLQEWDTDTDTEYHEYTVDLSDYMGPGYIAIRDFNVEDMYIVIVDDITIVEGETGEVVWGDAITGITSPYELTGLEPETYYRVRVRANCGEDGYSEWAEGGFKTKETCLVPDRLTATDIDASSAKLAWNGIHNSYNVRYRTAEYREELFFTDFDDDELPDGWTTTGELYYWTGTTDWWVFLGYTEAGTQYLITSDLSEYENADLIAFSQRYYGAATNFKVGFSTTTSDVDAFEWSQDIAATSSESIYSVNIPTGAKYFGIQVTTSSAETQGVIIDDVAIYGPAIPAGDWTTVTVASDNIPYTAQGLIDNREYEWQVQGINASCDGGVTEWSDLVTFKTEPSCLVPTDFDVNDITTDSAVLSWESDADSFDLLLNDEVIEGVESPYTLDLEPGTYYEVKVRAVCDEENVSDWSSKISFYTECLAFELPYEYNFDDVLTSDVPEIICWTRGSTMTTSTGLYYRDEDTGDVMFAFEAYGNTASSGVQYLITPEFVPSDNPVVVEFEYQAPYDNESYGYDYEMFTVGYMLEGETSFTWLDDVEVTSVDEWTVYSEELPAGVTSIVILYEAPGAIELNIDNFSISEVGGIAQTIEITEGWNWVSFNLVIDDETAAIDMLDQLKEQLGDNAEQIQSFEFTTEYQGDLEWFGDLDEVGVYNEQTYLIQANANCTVVLTGAEIAAAEYYTIEINPGWNWFGFPNGEEISVEDAMIEFEAEEEDQMQSQDNVTEYTGDEWFGDLETFVPGEGYMYFSKADDVKYLTFYTGYKKSTTRSKATKGDFTIQKNHSVIKMNACTLPKNIIEKGSMVFEMTNSLLKNNK